MDLEVQSSGEPLDSIQVPVQHYNTGYINLGRWSTYHTQIKLLASLKPDSVLEIGVGDGTTRYYVSEHLGVTYTTLDFDSALHPDIVGDIRTLNLKEQFDIVCAFQVLEHIPFEALPLCLSNLLNASKKYVIISLPHHSFHIKLELKLPLLPHIHWFKAISRPTKHAFDGQHYWELGKQGFSLKSFRQLLSKQANVIQEFSTFEAPGKRFYVLEKRA